jgi:hypothetical protein
MKALVLRNTSWLPATMLFAFAVAFVDGFVPRHTRNVIAAPIQAYNPYGHSGDEAGPLARNKARTDIRNLLTQRSIQSFVYLLNEVHDFPTTTWIEVRQKLRHQAMSSNNSSNLFFSYATENFRVRKAGQISWNRSVELDSLSILGLFLFADGGHEHGNCSS